MREKFQAHVDIYPSCYHLLFSNYSNMATAAVTSSILISNRNQNLQAPTVSSSVPSVSECSHKDGLNVMLKVPSLVFDIELEDNGIGGQWQEDDWEEDEVVSEIQRFVQPSTPAEAQLLSDVRVACSHAMEGQDKARLLSILSALGYKCNLRTALGGGDGADCLRNLRHTFITCEASSGAIGGSSRRYVIDPQFREQFIIAKTTARYAAILAAVPALFVGPEEHLLLLVNFLCAEMRAAFRQLGSMLPPWRQASSMLSKWKPRNSIDKSNVAAVLASGAQGRCCSGGEFDSVATIASTITAPIEMDRGSTKGAFADALGGAASELQALMAPPLSTCRPDGCQQPQQSQQAAQHWKLHQVAAAPAMKMSDRQQPQQAQTASSGRPRYEPQRVVFGGDFIPIGPSPAMAL